MGLVTLIFDLLTLKLVRESHQRWGTFPPNLGRLGLWVLELFAMYATDGQMYCTDVRTDKSNTYCPFPYGRGHNNDTKRREARQCYNSGRIDDNSCLLNSNRFKIRSIVIAHSNL